MGTGLPEFAISSNIIDAVGQIKVVDIRVRAYLGDVIRDGMKRLLKNILSIFGVELIKTKYQSVNVKKGHLECFFEILVREGFNPKCVFDIGANHGTWTRRALEFFPDSRYLLFEPQAHMEASSSDLIEKYDVYFYPFGLGSQSGLFPFTYHARDDSCSFNIDSAVAEMKG